ncbi:TPA: hypothetical protein NO534_002912 [Klebsiella pneumoniae]|nr:hypothetical protein [Klebsiella pneumoniae]
MNTQILETYRKTRADRLDQVRSKIAVLNAVIEDIEVEMNVVYEMAMGDQCIGDPCIGSTAFAALDKEYANMAADLRSAKETSRVLLAHMTAALCRRPEIELFKTGDTPNES